MLKVINKYSKQQWRYIFPLITPILHLKLFDSLFHSFTHTHIHLCINRDQACNLAALFPGMEAGSIVDVQSHTLLAAHS